jgi:hypothetical protein
LRQRIDDYAGRHGITFTDSVILALQRGFGDQRGITLSRGQRGHLVTNADGTTTFGRSASSTEASSS